VAYVALDLLLATEAHAAFAFDANAPAGAATLNDGNFAVRRNYQGSARKWQKHNFVLWFVFGVIANRQAENSLNLTPRQDNSYCGVIISY
jgi:hypothetical protein